MTRKLCGYLSLLTVMAVYVSSCKKHDDPTRTDMLTSGKWRITANTISADIGTGTPYTLDLYSNQQPCMQDNLSIFRSDSHLISDEGPTMCSTGGNQQTDQGTWMLSDNDTRLSIASTGFTLNYKINSMDAGTIVLQYDTTVLGFSATNLVTYVHQD